MNQQFITPSEVIEYLYCPAFIYFMNVVNIEQHEHRRHLVNKGRDIHQLKLVTNKDYLRSKLGAIEKHQEVYLSSQKLGLVGVMDEVLILKDGSAMPLDYKFAFWDQKVFKTHKMQQTLYALLIEENLQLPVHQAAIVYVRSKNHLELIPISTVMKNKALDIMNEIYGIVNDGVYPKITKNLRKCEDCTYRNLCVS